MLSLNRVELIGHVGADPELKYTPTNKAVVNISVATSERFTDGKGEKQERTEWHRVVIWEKLAELTAERVSKGDLIYIEGRIQTRQYETKEGEKRYATDIVAGKVLFIGGKKETSAGSKSDRSKSSGSVSGSSSARSSSETGGTATSNSDDDIPF